VDVVRHHDDGFTLLAVERLQQIQDLVARLAIEVTGGFITQQGGVGDDCAGNANRCCSPPDS
jgi:hypothetical protein